MKPVAIQYSDTLSYLSLIVSLNLPFISSYFRFGSIFIDHSLPPYLPSQTRLQQGLILLCFQKFCVQFPLQSAIFYEGARECNIKGASAPRSDRLSVIKVPCRMDERIRGHKDRIEGRVDIVKINISLRKLSMQLGTTQSTGHSSICRGPATSKL